MNKFISTIEKYLMPLAVKLNNQRHLGALRDGFIASMSVTIIGAIAVMINNVFLNFSEGSIIATVFLDAPISVENYPDWVTFLRDFFNTVVNGSLSIVALIVSFTIAYKLTTFKNHSGLEAGILSVCALFVSILITDGTVNIGNFGSSNIISAILIALVTGEVYSFCIEKNFRIKMPETVPPAVANAFTSLIPGIIIIFGFALIQTVIVTFSSLESFSDVIQIFIATPLQKIGGGAIGIYIYDTLAQFFWFFGIHSSTLGFMSSAFLQPASIQNAVLINDGIINAWGVIDQATYSSLPVLEQASMYTPEVVSFYNHLGGSGATLGLIIAIFLGSKVESDRKVAKFALVPSLFNINEPILFGLPVVFNPILFLPFVLIHPILMTIVFFVMKIGLVPLYSIPMPWTSPPVLGAYLAYGGSIQAAILALCLIGVSTAVYYPFVIVMNRAAKENNAIEGETV